MKSADHADKALIIDILARAFESNQSVNYILKQDSERLSRIRALMDYSFEICSLYGKVFISDDKKACALLVYPDRKKTTLKSTLLNIKLIFKSIGLANITKTLKREKLISGIQPKIKMTYLWFIGVDPDSQNEGIGTRLLQEIIEHSNHKNRPVYLETSTTINIPWYRKSGFEVYHEQGLTYRLYFLKKDAK